MEKKFARTQRMQPPPLLYLAVNAMTKPMQVREDTPPYGGNRP